VPLEHLSGHLPAGIGSAASLTAGTAPAGPCRAADVITAVHISTPAAPAPVRAANADNQPAALRARGPIPGRALGGRPHHRQGPAVSYRHPRRTPDPAGPAAAPSPAVFRPRRPQPATPEQPSPNAPSLVAWSRKPAIGTCVTATRAGLWRSRSATCFRAGARRTALGLSGPDLLAAAPTMRLAGVAMLLESRGSPPRAWQAGDSHGLGLKSGPPTLSARQPLAGSSPVNVDAR
jgi:hypothetical protein